VSALLARWIAWRTRRKIPVVKFGDTVRVVVHGTHYYMRLSELTVDHTGATATLRPVSDWLTK